MEKFQNWVPQRYWDELRDFSSMVDQTGRTGGQYMRARGLSKRAKGAMGGHMRLNVFGKDPTRTGPHEAGHMMVDILRNYSKAQGKFPKLAKALRKIDDIQLRSSKLEDKLDWVAKDSTWANEFKQFRDRLYLMSPEETMARALSDAYQRGDSFESAVRRTMKTMLDSAHNHERILQRYERHGARMGGLKWKRYDKEKPTPWSKINVEDMLDWHRQTGKNVKLPQLKGALGREKLEKELGNVLWQKGYPKEVVANVQSTMQHATIDDLKKLLEGFKGGK
jgi:hypothetical protein